MSENMDTVNSHIDPALVEQAMALITSSQRIALLAHESPDGDCIGSALGLAHILHQIGKDCVPACADAAPRNLSFLPRHPTFVVASQFQARTRGFAWSHLYMHGHNTFYLSAIY